MVRIRALFVGVVAGNTFCLGDLKRRIRLLLPEVGDMRLVVDVCLFELAGVIGRCCFVSGKVFDEVCLLLLRIPSQLVPEVQIDPGPLEE